MFECIREYRLTAEFIMVRVIDTVCNRDRVERVMELLVAAAFSRLLPFVSSVHTDIDRLVKTRQVLPRE